MKLHPFQAAFKKFVYLKIKENIYVKHFALMLESIEKEKENLKIKEYKEKLKQILIDNNIKVRLVFGDNPLVIWIHEKDLSQLRRLLRNTYGEWSDKIDRTFCSGESLDVRYKALKKTPVPLEIEVDYDINNLPQGLLKPGCRVEREVITSESCRIVCDTK
jgi:hypothetical protein